MSNNAILLPALASHLTGREDFQWPSPLSCLLSAFLSELLFQQKSFNILEEPAQGLLGLEWGMQGEAH